MNQWVDIYLRLSLVLGIGLICWRLSSQRNATTRVNILRATLLISVFVPVISLFGPQYSWQSSFFGTEVVQYTATLVEVSAAPAASEPIHPGWWFYGGISLLLLLPMIAGFVYVTRRWVQAGGVSDSTLSEVRETMETLEVRSALSVREDEQRTPFVFGVIISKLLLPNSFSEWPQAHRQATLYHEATHIKRFDCAWQLLGSFACVVYWCQPLFWILSRALKDESELAADEGAILSGAEATDYASALVGIARTLKQQGVLVQAQGVHFMNERQLDRRVQSALSTRRRGFSSLSLLAALFAAISGSIAISTVKPAPQTSTSEVIADGMPLFEAISDSHATAADDTKASTQRAPIVFKGIPVTRNAAKPLVATSSPTKVQRVKGLNLAKAQTKALSVEGKEIFIVEGHSAVAGKPLILATRSKSDPVKVEGNVSLATNLQVSVAGTANVLAGHALPSGVSHRDQGTASMVAGENAISVVGPTSVQVGNQQAQVLESSKSIAVSVVNVVSGVESTNLVATVKPDMAAGKVAKVSSQAVATVPPSSHSVEYSVQLSPSKAKSSYKLQVVPSGNNPISIALPNGKVKTVNLPPRKPGEKVTIVINEKGDVKVTKG